MSTGLEKATLQEVRSGTNDLVPVKDTELEVQFNPESLRLTHRNEVEGGETRGRQVRQQTGRSSTELSFDLVFDTADEIGEDGRARDVRERTAMVERFLIPDTENGQRKATAPMVRFHWGELVLSGVMTTLSIDFELFAPDGTPLRAKMGVSIREQDPRYQYLEAGAGANRESTGSSVGPGPDGVGGSGRPGDPGSDARGDPDRTAPAQAGESLADFAARQGLDPSRWRAVADQVTDSLSVPAGTELSFDSSLEAALGVGSRTGATASAGASVEARLGLESGAAGLTRGKALAGAGGLSAAIATADGARSARAAAGERSAFGLGRDGDGRGVGEGATTLSWGAPSAPDDEAGDVDPRARTFGRGIPLRPRRGGGESDAPPLLRGIGTRPDRRSNDAHRVQEASSSCRKGC